MIDRTAELMALAEPYLQDPALEQDQVLQMRARSIIKPLRKASPFGEMARAVGKSIQDLKEFIQLNQKTYLATGGVSSAEKDKLEGEVGLFIKTCTAQIEKLKNSVLVAQGKVDAHLPYNVKAPPLNAQAAAHYHGVVLILAEQLGRVSQAFDKYRAMRYKQITEADAWRRQLRSTPDASSSSFTSAGGFSSAPSFSSPSSSGRGQNGLGVLSGRSGRWNDVNGTHMQAQPSMSRQGQQGQQQQQQTLVEEHDEQALIEHLSSLGRNVLGVERTVREIAMLNQMFSTAVLHQAEQIETLYMQAVEASHHITEGNKALVKTLAINRSSSAYILALLVIATACLLFYDWFNS